MILVCCHYDHTRYHSIHIIIILYLHLFITQTSYTNIVAANYQRLFKNKLETSNKMHLKLHTKACHKENDTKKRKSIDESTSSSNGKNKKIILFPKK